MQAGRILRRSMAKGPFSSFDKNKSGTTVNCADALLLRFPGEHARLAAMAAGAFVVWLSCTARRKADKCPLSVAAGSQEYAKSP
jgi:hypothetical protein